jgi:hypothetical protein
MSSALERAKLAMLMTQSKPRMSMEAFRDKNRHILQHDDLDDIAARQHREQLDAERAAKLEKPKDSDKDKKSMFVLSCLFIMRFRFLIVFEFVNLRRETSIQESFAQTFLVAEALTFILFIVYIDYVIVFKQFR